MAKKLTTIYIDDTSIRLLTTKGNLVKSWAGMSLKQGLIEGLIVNDTARVAAKLTQLIKKHKIPTRKVVLGISAVNCLTRQLTMPSLPRNMFGEAVLREARRLLPLPLEQLYLSWQIVPSSGDKTQVLLIAIRRTSIESLIQALKLAKLKVQNLTIKPLALTRLVKDKNAIIVDVQSSEFDVVVMADSIPQPIRTVSFSSQELSWQEKSQTIIDEIDRTIKFYNTNNSGKPLDPNAIMYVSGELSDQQELHSLLSDKFGFRVEPLQAPMNHPAGFPSGNYLVNIGLAGKQLTAISEVSRLNLLPEAFRPNQIKWSRALAIPCTAIFASVAITLVLLIAGASDNITSARNQLDVTSKILQEKQLQKQAIKKEIKVMGDTLKSINVSNDACVKFLDTLTIHADNTNRDLLAVVDNLPGNVSIIGISLNDQTLIVQGTATSEADSLNYAKALENTGRFTQTVVSNINLENGTSGYILTLLK
ncbi:MAG: pilus assembly protein PilM [Dehalococcoidales bacterium]|nr:pilus assembly protein PilM [Dehalococcoidales bacterium]